MSCCQPETISSTVQRYPVLKDWHSSWTIVEDKQQNTPCGSGSKIQRFALRTMVQGTGGFGLVNVYSPVESKSKTPRGNGKKFVDFERIKAEGGLVMTPYYAHSTKSTFPLSYGMARVREQRRFQGLYVSPNQTLPGNWGSTLSASHGIYTGADFKSSAFACSGTNYNLIIKGRPEWAGSYDKNVDTTIALTYTDAPTLELNQRLSKGEMLAYVIPEKLKSAAVADLRNRYDLLTDLAEVSASASMIKTIFARLINLIVALKRRNLEHTLLSLTGTAKAYKPKRFLDAAVNRKGQHKSRSYDEVLANNWLEFQYGITPLVLSAWDILSMYEKRHDEYLTVRKVQTEFIDVTFEPSTTEGIYYEYSGLVSGRATGKATFDNKLANLKHGINTNWLYTANEVIPWMMVVNWFINIGDLIMAYTSTPVKGVTEMFCFSTKLDVTERTYWRRKNALGQFEDHLIRITHIRDYDRDLYKPTDVKLALTFSITSWKRQVSAIALSLKPLKTALRRLI